MACQQRAGQTGRVGGRFGERGRLGAVGARAEGCEIGGGRFERVGVEAAKWGRKLVKLREALSHRAAVRV